MNSSSLRNRCSGIRPERNRTPPQTATTDRQKRYDEDVVRIEKRRRRIIGDIHEKHESGEGEMPHEQNQRHAVESPPEYGLEFETLVGALFEQDNVVVMRTSIA